jgi:hypothetical protein
MHRRIPILLIAAAVGLASLAVTATATPAVASPPPPATVQPLVQPDATGGVLHGDYAGAILSGNDINVTATINALVGAHVTTYAYLICGTNNPQNMWADLPGFLSAPATNGISVWVYLCPPTEAHDSGGSPDMPPFNWDYVTWATQIAQLSLTHPNLTAYAMDDFASNGSTFTRAYVAQMVNAGRAVNPAIRFLPVLYWQNIYNYTNMIGPYRYYIDGVIFPYRDASHGGDTTNYTNAPAEIEQVASSLQCVHGNSCYQLYFPPSTASGTGWSVQVTQTVTVDPSAAAYGLTLNVWDDYTSTTSGYRYARVLVNGTVVWSRDINGDQSGSSAVTVSPTALMTALHGKSSATVALQMYDAKAVSNFHSTVTFDNLVATGFTVTDPDLENNVGGKPWPGTRTSTAYLYGYTKNIAPVVMVYAYKLSSQPDRPTPTYVQNVVSTGLTEASEGHAEGTMIYDLNLTGTDTPTATQPAMTRSPACTARRNMRGRPSRRLTAGRVTRGRSGEFA